jgi:outer membrane protein insertion porin family
MSKIFTVIVRVILLLLLNLEILFSQTEYGIRKISFLGNHTFSSDILLKKMSMYETGTFQETILRKEPFIYDENMLDVDLQRLKRFYQHEGFLQVQVDLSDVQFDDKNNKVYISIAVQENKPVKVRTVQFKFLSDSENISMTSQAVVLKRLSSNGLKTGERFHDEALEADKTNMIDALSNLGYALPHIETVLTLYEDEYQVDILWKIDSGPKFIFGKTRIYGNTNVPEKLIRKQLQYSEADLYRKRTLDITQKRIVSLGLFNSVSVKAVVDDSNSYKLPVQINVKEEPRFSSRFGLGYGNEDHFRVFINFQKLAFLGGARQASLLLKHSGLEPYNFNLVINQPHFLIHSITLSLNPFLREEVEPSYTAQRLGMNIPLNYQISSYLNSSLTYFYERVDLQEQKLSDQFSDPNDETLYNKSGFILGTIWDSSKPLFNPLGGMYLGASIKANGLSIKADYPYLKYILDFRQYNNLVGKVWALRLKIGTITTENADDYIPLEERFYLGGSRSVRGWNRKQLGPVDDQGIPLGGKSVFEGSLEIRQYVISGFSSVLFIDFGTISEKSLTFPLEETHFSPGFGLRYATPIGPIRLDFAFPIKAPGEKMKFYFDVGQAF